MNKKGRMLFLILVCLGVVTLLAPTYSAAFPPIKLGEETELTFYGFLRNNTGMFLQNPQPFAQSSNDLVTERTWLRGNVDFKISNQLRFGSVIQFAYEPEYDVEKGAGGSYRTPIDHESRKNGREYSEYRNINDVLREAYIVWKPAKEHTIKVGRQIAIWGEALTTRVGDVIHPEDQRYSLAFANLEDTRVPSWMVRGIHDIEAINSTFEWIVNPNLVQNKYRVNRLANFISLGQPGQRFSLYPETRFEPPLSITNVAIFHDPTIAIPHPFSREWFEAFPGFWAPHYLPSVRQEYPHGWESLRGGFRTNTTLGGYTFGLFYFHTQDYNPVVKRGPVVRESPAPGAPGYRYFGLVHPNIDIIGAYMNKDLTVIPGVLRFDAIYIPNKPFNTFDLRESDAVVRKDYVKYMIAYDLTGFLYFAWHKTAPFDITIEHVGEWIPKNNNLQYISYSTEMKKWNPSFNMRISTNWRYNQIATELIVGYIPWGRSGLIMPAVKYTPPVLNQQLSFELKYINIFGKNDYEGLGILRKKDMIVFTTQFNW